MSDTKPVKSRRALIKASAPHVLKDRVIQRLTEAEKALAFAAGIDQVKLVLDVAAAQEVFAKRQQLGEEVIATAHVLKTRALAKLGELLTVLPKAAGGSVGGRHRIDGSRSEPSITTPTLAEIGIDRKTSMVAQQLAALPEETREAIAQRETTITKVNRERKAATICKEISLPDAKYRVVYADPPWRYNDTRDLAGYETTAAVQNYPTMSVAELSALPVRDLAHADAVLFCWATFPLLPDCLAVVKAWGFTYKTAFVWDKGRSTFGHYHTASAELLFVCTRGSAVPDAATREPQVIRAERGRHSEKPTEFRALIDRLYTAGRRIELFRRGDAPSGWDVWGHEAEQAS